MLIDFNVDAVMYLLKIAKFPSHKWKSLANGLMVTHLVPNIEADCKDSESMLNKLIYQWVTNTTGNQWVKLINAVAMCGLSGVAEDIASYAKVDFRASRSGNTISYTRVLDLLNTMSWTLQCSCGRIIIYYS